MRYAMKNDVIGSIFKENPANVMDGRYSWENKTPRENSMERNTPRYIGIPAGRVNAWNISEYLMNSASPPAAAENPANRLSCPRNSFREFSLDSAD